MTLTLLKLGLAVPLTSANTSDNTVANSYRQTYVLDSLQFKICSLAWDLYKWITHYNFT